MPGERAFDLAEGPRRYWGRRGPFPFRPYHPRVTRPRGIGRAPSTLLLLGLLGLAPIACSTNPAATASPVIRTPRPTTVPSEAPASVDPTPELPSQSESEWGLIWDAVPDSFPVPIDAAVADPPQQGPVSGAWTVPVADVSAPALAGYYRDTLDENGWSAGIDGPLEDGSYTVWSTDAYGCETLTRIVPRGDESLITAFFGAGCPFR